MNEVFLSGIITRILIVTDRPATHFSFELSSLQHNTSEPTANIRITINTWDKLAKWSADHLHIGGQILVTGILIQAPNEENSPCIELAATRIVMV